MFGFFFLAACQKIGTWPVIELPSTWTPSFLKIHSWHNPECLWEPVLPVVRHRRRLVPFCLNFRLILCLGTLLQGGKKKKQFFLEALSSLGFAPEVTKLHDNSCVWRIVKLMFLIFPSSWLMFSAVKLFYLIQMSRCKYLFALGPNWSYALHVSVCFG